MMQSQRSLEQGRNAGGALEMPDVRLDRAERNLARPRAGKRAGKHVELNGIPGGRACPVALHVADGFRAEPARLETPPQRQPLPVGGWQCKRSLAAVALLVAIFKARPSPFYILDEVEAALDDANLGRLLEIFSELREDSQLIVVTHQKRTMEIADALYGVTMRGDGVTTVISQRMSEETA